MSGQTLLNKLKPVFDKAQSYTYCYIFYNEKTFT